MSQSVKIRTLTPSLLAKRCFSQSPDHYRYHDVLHLGHLVFLGWPPSIRSLLRRKRKSDLMVDDNEDGLRAVQGGRARHKSHPPSSRARRLFLYSAPSRDLSSVIPWRSIAAVKRPENQKMLASPTGFEPVLPT
ncbi:hypothetical protein [Candidatus Binatus sp.]|uniref:hypothetical protein n=1 Tax=Candidatus Binatus sp. TaxID=2811406 RepID=UPI003C6F534D